MSATWRHLGFHETTEEQLAGWNVEDADLVHMQNTLQVCVGGGGHLQGGGILVFLGGWGCGCKAI